ncbi:MAG: hypothetical protein KDD66_08465 [Bdellovibrionales bacterium]|nr:hypothetical protein [Bdellovibrionales bacterium]
MKAYAHAESLAYPDEQNSNVPRPKPYPWILHPTIDLLFCCGGLVWLFFAARFIFFSDLASFQQSPAVLALLVLVGHLFSDPHTAATLVRVYRNEESRKKYHFCTTWAALLCAVSIVVGVFIDDMPRYMLKAYTLLVIHHYMAQTYGLALLYCYKQNYRLSALHKRIFWLLAHCTTLFAILRELTFPEWGGRNFLYYQLPFIGPLPQWMFLCSVYMLAGAIAVFAIMTTWRAAVRREVIPFPALLLMITGAAIFIVSGQLSSTLWLFVPALYHGSQYMVVATAYYLKEAGLPNGLSNHRIAEALTDVSALRYFAVVVAGGICIYVGVPYIISEFGVPFTAAFVVSFSAFNFHHFLTDREIWKMRDPQTRRLLLE